jgi:selenocysteine lyase/cysteine desulfurase
MTKIYTLADCRELFPITRDHIYLNHAATSLLSLLALEGIEQHLRERSQLEGDNFERLSEKIPELRVQLGRLVGCAGDRIALVQNTSMGLNIVASGIDWQPGDEILIPEQEFPANVYPFLNLKRRGVRVKFLPTRRGGLEPETLQRAITPRTRLLSVSFVEYLSGYKHDLRVLGNICRSKCVIFCVDGIQGVGVIPIDVVSSKVDALACGGHKWLMFSQGFGFFYISKELQEHLQPAYLGWLGVENPSDFINYNQEPASDARRYEMGAFCSLGVYSALNTLKLFFDIGIDRIYRHLLDLTTRLMEGLNRLDFRLYTNPEPRFRSGIVTFMHPQAELNEPLFNYLKARSVSVSLRSGMIRVSPHIENNTSDIDAFLQHCENFLKANT